MTIGERIQELRKANGLTQKELAQSIGVATGTIQQYELDKRRPRPEHLQRLSEVLGATANYLQGFEKRRVIIPGRLTIVEINDPELDNYVYRIEAEDEEAHKIGLDIVEKAGISVDDFTPKGRIVSAMERLNEKGQAIAVERVEELTKIPDYQRQPEKKE